MRVLGVDIETTSLDVNEADVIELAAVLWDTERKCPLKIYSEFIDISPRRIDSNTQKITGIMPEDLKSWGKPLQSVLAKFAELAEHADAIVSHNGFRFDWPIIYRLANKEAIGIPEILMIDTMYDLPFPEGVKTRALKYLATEHGFLNPFPHRALSDVLTMLKILSYYDFEEVWSISSSQFVRIEAKVSYDNRGSASALGFTWNPNAKVWSKVMRRALAEKVEFPFPIETTIVDLEFAP